MVYFCVASTKIYLYLWRSKKPVAKQLICGTVLEEDSVVRIRQVYITGDEMEKEESALAVY